MPDAVLNALIGVVTGVIASWLFWLWLTRGLSPRLAWSDKISINSAWPGGGTKYRVKIMNIGRRAAVEFSATCVLRVPGVATGSNYRLVRLRTLDVPLPRLERGRGRIITIKTDGLDDHHVAGLPEPLRSSFNQSPPTPLQDVLATYPGSEIVLYLAAYDEVSGTRRHFRSHPYTLDSFTALPFLPGGVGTDAGGPI